MSIVHANQDAFIGHNGVPTRIQLGEVWDSEDGVVKANPAFFDFPPEERPKKKAEPPVTGTPSAPSVGGRK